MKKTKTVVTTFLILCIAANLPVSAFGQQVRLLQRALDPYGSPRPANKGRDVPLRTSIYFELGPPLGAKDDPLLAESVLISLQASGGDRIDVLRSGQRFAKGASGWLRPMRLTAGADLTAAATEGLAVYIEPGQPLRPATTYMVRVTARSQRGAELPKATGTWSFTTEAAPGVRPLKVSLDLGSPPVQWHGAFFSGVCNVVFCTRAATFGPTYHMMNEARKQHPRAWSLQRDIWMGTEEQSPWYDIILGRGLPNIVRERETRRIAAMEKHKDGMLLRVEDFFGHQQYGIPSGRPVGDDYHLGDEVLVADGVHDARAKVLAADSKASTVLIGPIAEPAGGWKIAYEAPLPVRENSDSPGLFPPGGCYLRKFRPHGTPCYYWGRLDKEWDIEHRRCGRRLLPNFCDAPGDLAVDGRNWTTAKDLVEWHEVAGTIAGHVIDRYGADAMDFTWSIFNEPDLGGLFWRSDWDELQRFYDYTSDAILRAFEDRGHDSNRVKIGGIELAAPFGPHLKLTELLAHFSPRATAKGALALNAAVADHRLDGKRSRRVEALCRAHGGKGSPCDFVSVHAYNRSETMIAKLFQAKKMALEIDSEYYRELGTCGHESCPEWNLPPDEAAADSYSGNGYFPSWCADVASRQLHRAAADPRYAFGETLISVWPPPVNFAGLDAISRILLCDDDGDGRSDRAVTVPTPIFHTLNLLSDLGDRYWVLPEQKVGGHMVTGFASRDPQGVVRVLLYSHHCEDMQSRSDAEFDVTLDLDRLGWDGPARVEEYRFDKNHNSYFRLCRELRQRNEGKIAARQPDPARMKSLLQTLDGQDAAAQRTALAEMEGLSLWTQPAACEVVAKLARSAKDASIREAAETIITHVFVPSSSRDCYSREEVEQVRKLAECRPTGSSVVPRQPGGALRLTARVAGNGLNFLVIRK